MSYEQFDAPATAPPATIPDSLVSVSRIITLYAATHGFATAPADVPQNTYFEGRMTGNLSYNRSAAHVLQDELSPATCLQRYAHPSAFEGNQLRGGISPHEQGTAGRPFVRPGGHRELEQDILAYAIEERQSGQEADLCG